MFFIHHQPRSAPDDPDEDMISSRYKKRKKMTRVENPLATSPQKSHFSLRSVPKSFSSSNRSSFRAAACSLLALFLIVIKRASNLTHSSLVPIMYVCCTWTHQNYQLTTSSQYAIARAKEAVTSSTEEKKGNVCSCYVTLITYHVNGSCFSCPP